MVVHLSTLPD